MALRKKIGGLHEALAIGGESVVFSAQQKARKFLKRRHRRDCVDVIVFQVGAEINILRIVLDRGNVDTGAVGIGHLLERRIDADLTVERLERLAAERGAPEHVRCDNGPELTANARTFERATLTPSTMAATSWSRTATSARPSA